MSDDFDSTDDTADKVALQDNAHGCVHLGDEAHRLLSVFSGVDTAIGTQALFLLHPPAAIASLHPSHLLNAYAQLPSERQTELRNLAPGIDTILNNMRMTLSVEERMTLSTNTALVQQHQMNLEHDLDERRRFNQQVHSQLQHMSRQFNEAKANSQITSDWDTVVLGPSPLHVLPAPEAEFQYEDSHSDVMPLEHNGRMFAFEPLCECMVNMLFGFGDAEEPSPAVIITLIDYVRDWLTPVARLLHRQSNERGQLAFLERHFPIICNMYFSFRQLRRITAVDQPSDESANLVPEIDRSDQCNDPINESASSGDTLLDIVPDDDDEHAREAISRIAYESVIPVFDHPLPVGPLCRQRHFASLLTRTMSHAQYLKFARARTTSFLSWRNLPMFSQLIGSENLPSTVNRLLGLIAWDRIGIITEVALYLHQQRANGGPRLSVYDIRLSLQIVQNWSWLLPREPVEITQSIASTKRTRNKQTRPVVEATNATTNAAKSSRKRSSNQADLQPSNSNISASASASANSPPASSSQPAQRRVSARVANKTSQKPL